MSRRRKSGRTAASPRASSAATEAATSVAKATLPPLEASATFIDAGDASVRQALFIAACFCVGIAVRIADGNYHPAAIALVGCAVVAVLLAVIDPSGIASRRLPRTLLVLLLLGFVAGQAVALIVRPLLPVGGIINPDAVSTVAGGLVGVAAGAALCAITAFASRGSAALTAAGIAVMLVSHLVCGVATLHTAVPPMDVIDFQDLAILELIDSGKPYSMTFPDRSGGTSPHYAPGLQAGGKLLFGFPYPPLSLLAVTPAALLTGDFRYTHVLAMTLVGAAIALIRRSPSTGLIAAMFLLTPSGPLVLASGWTEPLVAALLALTVWTAARRPPLAGLPLGLFWSVKQYVPLTAALMVLLPKSGRGTPATSTRVSWHLVIAIVVGAAVTLPLAMVDFPAFWQSTVALQLKQPFREDALSLLSVIHRMTGDIPPSWPAFVALAVVQALAIWRMPRTAAGFAGATAASLLVFFALSKQAFANYYVLVIAAAALAAAAETPPERQKSGLPQMDTDEHR